MSSIDEILAGYDGLQAGQEAFYIRSCSAWRGRNDRGRPALDNLNHMGSGMRKRKHPITPLAAVVGGLLAGAVGTASMDTIRYLRYRRAGGQDSPLAWEFAPVESWDKAPDPGQIGKRVIEGFTQRELPDRWAFLTSTVMHWGYGSTWGALYGVLAGSLSKPRPLYGLPFATVVWASDYLVLPQAGLYKPIWEYDAKTLASDLSAHLGYGAGTGGAFWLIVKVRAVAGR